MKIVNYTPLVIAVIFIVGVLWLMFVSLRGMSRRSKGGWDALKIAEHAITNAETKEELQTANDLLLLASDHIAHDLHDREYEHLLIKLQGKTIHYLTKKKK